MLEELNALRRNLMPENEEQLEKIMDTRYRGRRIGDLQAAQLYVLVYALVKSIEHYRKIVEDLAREKADLSLQLAVRGR